MTPRREMAYITCKIGPVTF